MTRLLTDGAESGDMLSAWINISAPFTASTTTKRTGNYSYRKSGAVGPSIAERILPTTPSDYYVRVAINLETFGSTNTPCIIMLSGATVGAQFGLSSVGAGNTMFSIYDGSTLRASSISTYTVLAGEQHVYEFHVRHAANPNGLLELKFDGSPVVSYTGTVAAVSNIDRIRLHVPHYAAVVSFDDIAINDTTGSVDNSWIGDGGVLAALVPTSTGTYVGFLASGSATTWQSIDEIPANSTDFIYTSVSGTKSIFNTSQLSGLPAGANISRIWVELYAKETAAVGDKIATLIRSGVTNVTGTSQNLTTAFARYSSEEYVTNPDTSGTWSVTEVNSVQIGAISE